jgi:HEAT repeat protein
MQAYATAALLLFAVVSTQAQTIPSTQPTPPTQPPSVKPLTPETSSLTEFKGKTFGEWTAQVTNRDPSKRAEAINSLVLFGKKAEEAVPVVIDRLGDIDLSPKAKAVMALRVMPVREADRPKLIEGLAKRVDPYTESQAIIRYEAARTLLAHAEYAQAAIPALLRAAQDRTTWETRQVCLAVLRVAGKEENKGPDPRVTQALLRALTDSSTAVRMEAIVGLGAMGRPGDPRLYKLVLDKLTAQVNRRNNPSLNIWARVSIMNLDEAAAEYHVKIIARYVAHDKQEIRLTAMQAVSAMRKYGKPAIPFLVEALNHRDELTAATALAALLDIDENDPTVQAKLNELKQRKDLPKLIKAVLDSHFEKDDKNKPVRQ